MRPSIRHLIQTLKEVLDLQGPVLEVGSRQVPGQEAIAELRPFFPGCDYLGGDIQKGRGVDRILDMEKLDLEDERFGTVMALETLEHVAHPWIGLREVHRVLKPDGVAIISAPMDFPIHHEPNDYYRYTPHGFLTLLEHFKHAVVADAGCPVYPRVVVGVGFKSAPEPGRLDRLLTELDAWSLRWPREPGLKARLRPWAARRPFWICTATCAVFGGPQPA